MGHPNPLPQRPVPAVSLAKALPLVLGYLVFANLVAFFLMGWDKQRAKKGRWRIRERTLLLWAVLGGSIGAFLGMQLFRHKTKHIYFQYGIPVCILIHFSLSLYYLSKMSG